MCPKAFLDEIRPWNRIWSLLILFLLFFHRGILSQNIFQSHGRLIVSSNGHYLLHEDGTPFFWLGDTAWELFHRLTLEEIEKYLDNRKEKGFNVIQAVILAEYDGLRKPNRYGEVPLIHLDPEKPNEHYFELVDKVIAMALERNMCMGLLPTWGDKVIKMWGIGPEIFNEGNAFQYGKWLGLRYKDCPNIVWILGGDRPVVHDSVDTKPIWRAMAKGILEGTENKALIGYHPSGGEISTSHMLHGEDWLDIHMMQSGHGAGHDVPVWEWIFRDWHLKPTRPTLDAEPNYEDHPVNPWPKWDPLSGYFSDYDVRKQTYRSVFSGACGVTYGHHSIWQFYSPREEKITHADRYWTEALDRPGAFQVGYLKKLIESRPFLHRIPDTALIEKGQGIKAEYITAFRDSLGRFLMVYLPVGKQITVNTSCIPFFTLNGWWVNPRTGEVIPVARMENKIHMEFVPPTLGDENDWVLLIDHPQYSYPIPLLK